MRVYVTLSEKELQISIKVPDSAGWDEFIQILRDRFKLHGSAKLIIATEGFFAPKQYIVCIYSMLTAKHQEQNLTISFVVACELFRQAGFPNQKNR